MLSKLKDCILSVGNPLPNIIMGGDYNLPRVSWENGLSKTLPLCPKSIRDMKNELSTFCDEFYLKQGLSKPTHKDGNVLDLIFTNNFDLISDVNVIETLLSISHHAIVEVSTVYKAKGVQDACIRPAPTGFQSLNFFSESVDREGIKNHIKQCDWSTMFQNKNVTEMLDCFYEVCLGAALNYVPERKLTKKKIHPKQKKVLRRRRQINKLLSQLKSPSRIDRILKRN